MRKITHAFIIGVLDFLIVGVFLLFFAIVGSIICGMIEPKPQEPVSLEDNRQLNEIKQYHRSQGREVLFTEDIFNNLIIK